MKKGLSIALSISLLSSVVSPVAFAAESNQSIESLESIESFETKLERIDENLIISESMSEIDEKIFNAESVDEVKSLIKEYNDLTLQQNSIQMLSAPTRYNAPNGGTLHFKKVDSNAPPSKNITYIKTEYYTPKQALIISKMLGDTGFKSFFKGLGVGTITDAAAKKIVKRLGLSATYSSTLVGMSASVVYHILDNLEKWDFEDAVKKSKDGSVKLERYSIRSVAFPYYQEIDNYEPWNSSYMTVPTGYSASKVVYGH